MQSAGRLIRLDLHRWAGQAAVISTLPVPLGFLCRPQIIAPATGFSARQDKDTHKLRHAGKAMRHRWLVKKINLMLLLSGRRCGWPATGCGPSACTHTHTHTYTSAHGHPGCIRQIEGKRAHSSAYHRESICQAKRPKVGCAIRRQSGLHSAGAHFGAAVWVHASLHSLEGRRQHRFERAGCLTNFSDNVKVVA